MEKIDLAAKARGEKGKQVKKVRLGGLIPAVVYGREIEAQAVSVDAKRFRKAISGDAGTNIIINLKIDNNGKSSELPVITCAMQTDPLTDQIIHVDFRNINMAEKIKTKVPCELVGIPVGVKDEGGVLVHNLHEIEIECLPADIPDKFKIDVTPLTINQAKHVSDLMIATGIKVLNNPEDPIAMVTSPTKEEEPAAAEVPEGEALAEGEIPAEGAEGAEGVEGAPTDKKVAEGKGAAPAKGKEDQKK